MSRVLLDDGARVPKIFQQDQVRTKTKDTKSSVGQCKGSSEERAWCMMVGRPEECGLGGRTTKQKTTGGTREACLGEDGPGEVPGKQKTRIGAVGERHEILMCFAFSFFYVAAFGPLLGVCS